MFIFPRLSLSSVCMCVCVWLLEEVFKNLPTTQETFPWSTLQIMLFLLVFLMGKTCLHRIQETLTTFSQSRGPGKAGGKAGGSYLYTSYTSCDKQKETRFRWDKDIWLRGNKQCRAIQLHSFWIWGLWHHYCPCPLWHKGTLKHLKLKFYYERECTKFIWQMVQHSLY